MDAAFFEGGADDEGVAGCGERPREEALGLAGGDAEEVLQGGAAGDGEGGEFVLGEQLAGTVDALLALGGRDGDGLVGAVLEGENWPGICASGGIWECSCEGLRARAGAVAAAVERNRRRESMRRL